ncbi:MAG: PDC sensor domain-containing protein [Oleiphilus sp.]
MRIITAACLLLFSAFAFTDEQSSLLNKLVPTLEKWGSDPILVAAVKQQNALNITLDSIKVRDAEWRIYDGVDEQMQALMSNPAAKKLLEMEQTEAFYFELFLMDNQGANVAMTNKTSDYWQGDEAKWKQSYNDGKGAVHIGDVEFDESAQDYLVQISVPIKDGEATIGALTIGVNLDILESQ